MKTELIPLDEITRNPWQTRAGIDPEYIEELANDILKNGLLQAPKGRRVDDAGKAKSWGNQLFLGKKIQIAFGHNRLAAYQHLAREHPEFYSMPVFVDDLSDEQMAMMAWSENAARKNLTAIEEATAIQRDITAFGWTQEKAAEKLGIARATVANKLRLLKLPAEVQKAIEEGKISERQASALLPMMDLPEEAIAYGNKNTQKWENSPSEYIAKVAKGEVINSDVIRQGVERLIVNSTRDLARCKFIDEIFEGKEFQSGRCANCTWRMKSKDSDRCGRPDCFELKVNIWGKMEGAEAIRISGLQLLPTNENHDNWDLFYTVGDDDGKAAAKVFKQGCEKLRIIKGYGNFHPNGIEGYGMACLHGVGGKCTCKAKALREIRKNDPVKAQVKENEKELEELKNLVMAFLGNELLAGNVHAWRAHGLYAAYDGKEKEAIQNSSADALAMRLVKGLVEHWVGYQPTADAVKAREKLEEELAKAGLKNPWSEIETPEQQAWKKVLRISGWMENLEKVLPKAEAVRGNIDNLYGLLGDMGMDEEQYSLIKIMIGLLEQVSVELGDMDDKAIEHVSWLLHTPPGDVNFKSHLEVANAATLRYTLALVPDGSGQMTRVEALEQRLRKITKKTLVEVFQEEEA